MSFAYTPANRLSSGTGPWGTYTWQYAGVGNRTEEVQGAKTFTYAYPTTTKKPTSVCQGASTVRSFNYDNAGNLIPDVSSGVTTAFTHNKRNRMLTPAKPGKALLRA